ncbi:hypothetical protein Hdeb2414_s0008g00277811 [Helianthus debilis subsp. tardiflorus]
MSIIFNKSFELLSTIVLIFLALLLFEVTDVHAQNGYLPQDEVRALRDIAEELGKRDWDFSLNPCDNNPNWATPNQTETSLYNNTVMCNCSYPGDVCQVIAMYVVFVLLIFHLFCKPFCLFTLMVIIKGQICQ